MISISASASILKLIAILVLPVSGNNFPICKAKHIQINWHRYPHKLFQSNNWVGFFINPYLKNTNLPQA